MATSPVMCTTNSTTMWSIAGTANLSKELIRSGFWGASLDKLYLEEDHDMLSLKGIKLFITTLLASRFGALHWFGTCCSSFAVLSQSVSLRSAANSFLGDESRDFVFCGNCMSEVSALLFFLSLIVKCCPVLEQPMSSTMPLTPSWHAILMFFHNVFVLQLTWGNMEVSHRNRCSFGISHQLLKGLLEAGQVLLCKLWLQEIMRTLCRKKGPLSN